MINQTISEGTEVSQPIKEKEYLSFSGIDIATFIVTVLLIFTLYNIVLVTFLKAPEKAIPDNLNEKIVEPMKVYKNTQSIDSIAISTRLGANLSLTQKMVYINEHPKFMFWLLGISLVNALAITLLWPMSRNIRKGYSLLMPKTKKKFRILLFCGIAISLITIIAKIQSDPYIATVPMLMSQFNILYASNSEWFMRIIVSLPSQFSGAFGMVGIGVLLFLTDDLKWDTKEDQMNSAERLIDLRDQFRNYVYLISGFILIGSLNTGLIREVMLSILGADFNALFPPDLVWAYGFRFSCVLALAYFPAFYYFEEQSKYAASMVKLVPATEPGKPWNVVKIILAALAPLLGTVAQELINLIGKI